MSLYPASIRLENKLCVVVGSGPVAKRKVKPLYEAGAKVKVIAPKAENIDGCQCIKRNYRKGDLKGAFLVLAATDDKETNRRIYEEATENNTLVNVVDNPELCNFYVPSVINRGKLQLTISTSGVYPALSKKLREQLENDLGDEFSQYLELLKEAREKVIEKYDKDERKAKLNEILNDKHIMNFVKEKKIDQARERINKWI